MHWHAVMDVPVSEGVSSVWLQQHKAFWNATSNIEGNWIARVCEDNLKMMSSTQNVSLGSTNRGIHRSFPW